MGKIRDLSGQTFGMWTVVSRETDHDPIKWRCICICGNYGVIASGDLYHKRSKSCGCHRSEYVSKAQTTHNRTHTKEYSSWEHMIQRCENPNNNYYHRYGGRGITVSPIWRKDFMAFYNEVGPAPSAKHSIERINNDKGYEPGNCKWAFASEQNNNTSKTRFFHYKDRYVSIQQARTLAKSEASYITVYTRIRDGWDFDKAIETPVSKRHSKNSRSGRRRIRR
jgi:hypothetical protein